MQIKLIFTRKVLHIASFWKGEFFELGNKKLSNELMMNRIVGFLSNSLSLCIVYARK